MAVFSVNAAHRIHDRLARRLVRFPQQFFEATPSGRILNRFSKDINDVDSQLSERWQFLLMCSLRVLSILIMLCVASWVFIPVLVVILGLYIYFREYYRRTARELQRIESISRSPVYAHFTEVMGGTDTIHAYVRKLLTLNKTEPPRAFPIWVHGHIPPTYDSTWRTDLPHGRVWYEGCAGIFYMLQHYLSYF